jgi:hypothetical protein
LAVSGSYNFTRTRNELVFGALRCINALASGETLSSEELTDAVEAMNMMIKTWEAAGVGIWLLQECTLFLQADQVEYTIGPSSTSDHWTATPYKTEIATAASASDGTVTVDDDANITDGDQIGVETDNGDIHYTTVNGTPAANVVTLTTALDYAAAVDNHVYNYTIRAQLLLDII